MVRKEFIVIFSLLGLALAGVDPATIDTILRFDYVEQFCNPLMSWSTVELECRMDMTSNVLGAYIHCNCSSDRRTILRWSLNPTTGVFTSMGNFTLNTCQGPSVRYGSSKGTCGGLPWDTYVSQEVGAIARTVQQGRAEDSSWPLVVAFAFIVLVFVVGGV
jgi:hypothetical protein